MKISIHQRAFSISDKFDIYIDDEIKYYSRRGLFSFTMKVRDQNNLIRTTVKRKNFYLFRSNYEISCFDNSKYRFKTISFLKGIWSITNDLEQYKLFEHEGYAFSLFKGENQIALCLKNSVTFLGKDKFEIEADYDVKIELLIAIFLIIDNAYFVDRANRLPLNLRFFEDGIPRDWHWKPKSRL